MILNEKVSVFIPVAFMLFFYPYNSKAMLKIEIIVLFIIEEHMEIFEFRE